MRYRNTSIFCRRRGELLNHFSCTLNYRWELQHTSKRKEIIWVISLRSFREIPWTFISINYILIIFTSLHVHICSIKIKVIKHSWNTLCCNTTKYWNTTKYCNTTKCCNATKYCNTTKYRNTTKHCSAAKCCNALKYCNTTKCCNETKW